MKLVDKVNEGFRGAVLTLAVSALLFNSGCSNFHAVEDGKFYRSAQLSKKELFKKIDKHNINSVINLRYSDKEITKKEREWCEAKNIDYYNVEMRHTVNRDKTLEVIDIIKKAKKPILVHCQGGMDRAGFVSAVYTIDFLNKPEKALDQLSFKYLHIRTMKPDFSKTIKDYLEDNSITHKSFENWMREDYH